MPGKAGRLPAALAVAALAWACLAAGSLAEPPQGPVEPWIWSDPRGESSLSGLQLAAGQEGVQAHLLPRLGMATFASTPTQAGQILAAAGGRLDANRGFSLHLDRSLPYIGADHVQAAVGPQADGPTVLIVDTGVDSLHPDFRSGNLAANVQPIRQGSLIVASTAALPVVDFAGHGTHVAGIVAGSGQALGSGDPLHGDYRGIYANGRLASYQAGTAEDEGGGRIDLLAVLEAYEWALEHQGAYRLAVVSNSWGSNGTFDPGFPIEQATLALYLAGFTVVFAAGNAGEDGPGTLSPHCVAPWVLCVAAGDLDGTRASFSSQGNATRGLPFDHPDLTAPGVFIRSAVPTTGSADETVGAVLAGQPPSATLYGDKSGTSMAAPHVAAAAALLLAARPGLSPDEVMDVLVATARPMDGAVEQVGAGYLDAQRAHALALLARGERAAFLEGQVKYAGPLSGDPDYANDPLTVGYDGPRSAPPPSSPPPTSTTPAATPTQQADGSMATAAPASPSAPTPNKDAPTGPAVAVASLALALALWRKRP